MLANWLTFSEVSAAIHYDAGIGKFRQKFLTAGYSI